MLPNVGWLEDLSKPMIGRVWGAFFGIGHTMEVVICTDPHFYFSFGGTPLASDAAPHLDLRLRVWNTGGPDVIVVAWQMPQLTETYSITGYPAGDVVLERSGKVIAINMVMRPKVQPLAIKPGDSLKLILHLSNGVPKHFNTKVT